MLSATFIELKTFPIAAISIPIFIDNVSCERESCYWFYKLCCRDIPGPRCAFQHVLSHDLFFGAVFALLSTVYYACLLRTLLLQIFITPCSIHCWVFAKQILATKEDCPELNMNPAWDNKSTVKQ